MHVNFKTLLSRVIPITALMMVVLFKFQNCAPISNLDVQSSAGEIDSEVRVVDRWAEQKVAFFMPSVVVPEQEKSVDLKGLCVGSQKGQMIAYQVIEMKDSPEVVDYGMVECILGGFELPIAQLKFTNCSSRLQVRAARIGEETNYAETVLHPSCTGS